MVLVLLLLLPLGALAVAAAAGTDRDALLAFKAGVSDPTGKLLWWNRGSGTTRCISAGGPA